MTCPNCAEPLGERGYFCKACAGQARCMKCREILEAAAAACVECGTRIGQPIEGANATSQPARDIAAIPANRNTLTYHEDRNSRNFEASLTDNAMQGLGEVFGELFAQRGVGRQIPPGAARPFVKDMVLDETKYLPPSTQQESDQQQPAPPPPKTDPEKDRVLRIFRQEGETLELSDNRLKAKSAADYYKRLTYLFIYAQDVLLGRSSAPKAELVEVLKAAKVYDANCRFWMKQKKGFTVDSEERMKLIVGAKEQAIKALDEALDSNVPDGWNPDTRTIKPRASGKKKK